MCTGFVFRGSDIVSGFNMDLADGAWEYKVYAKPDMFFIGIKAGSTVYKTHGVNSRGSFAVLPYMNAPERGVYSRGRDVKRIDLLVNDCIAGKLSLTDIKRICAENRIVNVPNLSMHSLLADGDGNALLVEAGLGCYEPTGRFAAISNFPLLEKTADLSAPWYGKDRYDTACAMLQDAGDAFSVNDALKLLAAVKQEGEWPTRVSFVYSRNENAVYYALDRDFSAIKRHAFTK